MGSRFVHLHCHTNYSLLEGASRIEDLIKAARDKGMDSLAITDTNGMYGIVPFFKAAKENGIKPIIGVEITEKQKEHQKNSRRDHKTTKRNNYSKNDYNRNGCGKSNHNLAESQTRSENSLASAVLLARDSTGYAKICEVVTERALSDEFSLADALVKRKREINGRIFVLTRNLSLLHLLSPHMGKETLFVEITNFDIPESRKRIRELTAASEELDLDVVATNDVHFLEPAGYHIHKVLRAIDLNTTLSLLPPSELTFPETFLKSEKEMTTLFEEFPEAIENARRIAENCSFEFDIGKFSFPKFPLPEGETPFSYLWKLCFKGISRRYNPLTPKVLERLKYEITVIESLGFTEYFIIVNDIANHARKAGIPLIGRGSAANSIVSYLLGITNVDPLEHDLYFERFLNPERKSPPDIDLDFCWRRRDDVLDYVYKKYGDEHAAMISTHVTFAWRSSIREVAKVLGIPEDEIGKFTKKIPHWGAHSIEETVKKIPECRDLPIHKEPFKTVIEIAKKIEGYPRYLSVHAGGIVIGEQPLTKYLPLERASKGIVITQFDMFSVEDVGLVKIDLLCQRSLSVREDTLEEIEKNYGNKPDLGNYPTLYNDKKTVELIRNGKTIGCFYIESPAMRGLLKKLDVSSFEMLTAASSVIRPGVAESGMMQQFIKRHKGEELATFLHPKLEKILGSTYGVMIYQEDVIRVAHELAGMSLAEADLLRRGMSGKGRSPEAMKEIENRFINSCLKSGVGKNAAKELWRQISSFAGYSFCKAHSASYAQLSFQVAYLKAHYPAEFMAAVLSNQGGFYHPSVYIEEARRMGITILPPDINRSEYQYIAEYSPETSEENLRRTKRRKRDAIRVGFLQIKGLSRRSIDSIISERRRGWFTSLKDFLRRIKVDPSEVKLLVRSGAFDSFELSRPELLWKLETLATATKREEMRKDQDQERERSVDQTQTEKERTAKGKRLAKNFLHFGYYDSLRSICCKEDRIVPRIPDFTIQERLESEMELFEFTVSAHPIELFKSKLDGQKFVSSADIPKYKGKIVRIIGWLDVVKRTMTSKGEYMKFITFEDERGIIEATLFPASYRRYGHLLNGRGPYIVTGKVEEEAGFYTLTINSLKPL